MSSIGEAVRTLAARLAAKATPGPIPLPEGYLVPGVPFYTGWSDESTAISTADMYANQPYLRIVIDFLARNIAQLGIGFFDRLADTDRVHITDAPSVALFRRPNPTRTRYELIRDLVSDFALNDRAYWWLRKAVDAPAGWTLTGLPAGWLAPQGGDIFAPTSYRYANPVKGTTQDIPADQIIAFHGWSPGRPDVGLSPVDTLKVILAEQKESHRFRLQLWKRSGRVGSFLTRPTTAPQWSEPAARQFREDWRASFSFDGPDAGRTPVLEDGMELKRVGFSAKEDEFVDASKLALTTVAAAYHVNPTMIGLLDNANYSNVREFRRMLYGDTLGPIIAQLEDRINVFLLPLLGEPSERYCEFNIAEKLQGSFEEQASVMSTLVGRPIMTANEGRARFNLAEITDADADELIVPLNVTVGGQPSPQSGLSATDELLRKVLGRPVGPSPGLMRIIEPTVKATRSGSYRPDPNDAQATRESEKALRDFFARQRKAVSSRMGKRASVRRKADGDPDWWDRARWDAELAQDLYEVCQATVNRLGPSAAAALGFVPGDFDVDRTIAFLQAVAASRAGWINQTTLDQLSEPDADPEAVFDQAIDVRSVASAAMLVTTLASFSATEAGHQLAHDSTSKTWIVTSSNPRKSHKRMSGETVDVAEKFSNGGDWPGDPSLGVDEVAGCTCTVEVRHVTQ